MKNCYSVYLFIIGFLVLTSTEMRASVPSDVLLKKADAYYANQQYDSALLCYQQFIKGQPVSNSTDSITRSTVLYTIGRMYRFHYYEPQTALTYLDSAILIQKKILSSTDIRYGKTLYELASVNRSLGKYEYASSCAQQALSIAEINKETKFKTNCLVMIANILNAQLKLNEANTYYLKAIKALTAKDPKAPVLSNYYNNLSISYRRLKMYDSATFYIQKSIKINKANGNLRALSNDYFTFGLLLSKAEKYEQALPIYEDCIRLRIEMYGTKHPEVALAYNGMARLFENTEKYNQSLNYTHKALISLIPEFDPNNLLVLPSITTVENRYEAFLILFNRFRVLNKILELSPKIENIEMAINTAIKVDSLLELNRSSFLRNGSKMFIQDHYNEFYEYYLNALYLKYNGHKSDDIPATIFRVIESNKSLLLLDELKTIANEPIVDVKDSLLIKERALQKELTINGLQIKSATGKVREELNQEAFRITQAYDLLIKQLAEVYPGYYHLKYKKISELDNIKEKVITEDQSLMTCFDGDQYLYVFYISKTTESLIRVEKDSLYQHNLEQLLASVYSANYMNKPSEAFFNLTSSGYYMYQKIFESIDLNKSNALIIIPDGELAYLPFEVLMTTKVTSDEINFKDLPYLLKKITLSYSYSASMLSMNDKIDSSKQPTLLGISYSSNINESSLGLQGTDQELKAIEKDWPYPYKMLYGSSEQYFKQSINDYDIIHIGLHGAVDSTSIDGTQLFFQTGGVNDDGILKAHELYSLNSHASLVFLSACETGFGKLTAGEGVYSLSRGFMYAGSKSVIQTLWKINDKISVPIIESFYKNVTNKVSARQSLTNAKLQFIAHADEITAHPYNWAAFQYVGEDYKIDYRKKNYYLIIFVLLTIVIIVVLMILVIRRLYIMHALPLFQ